MKKIIYILMMVLLTNLVSAITIVNIDIKSSFTEGETVKFDYTINSDKDQTITYLPHVICPNAPVAFLQEKTIDLKVNQPYIDNYKDITIDKFIEPQTCTAYIQIISPEKQLIEKNFTISTSPSFSFNIKTCKDQSCAEKSKVFLKDESIYINYDSEVQNPTIRAVLLYPNEIQKELTIPTLITADQIGTYELKVIASKENYKTIEKITQFGVIKEQANIPYTQPQKASKKFNFLYLIFPALLIILIVLILLYLKRKKKQQFYYPIKTEY